VRAVRIARKLRSAEHLAAAARGVGVGLSWYRFICRSDAMTMRLLYEADAALDDVHAALRVELARSAIEIARRLGDPPRK
jgi:hypothetical protein